MSTGPLADLTHPEIAKLVSGVAVEHSEACEVTHGKGMHTVNVMPALWYMYMETRLYNLSSSGVHAYAR